MNTPTYTGSCAAAQRRSGCKPDLRLSRFVVATLALAITLPTALRAQTAGTLDPAFNPDAGGEVVTAALQPDGKIVIGGFFIEVGGVTRVRIARLNSDGTVESTATFNPGTGANNTVSCVDVQADGKILLAGDFTSVNGQTHNRIARLNADGTVESTATFNPGTGASSTVIQHGGAGRRKDSARGRLHDGEWADAQTHRATQCGWDAGEHGHL